MLSDRPGELTFTMTKGVDELTPREFKTRALVADGHDNAAIAERLVLANRAWRSTEPISTKFDLGDPNYVSGRVMAALLYASDRQHSAAK